MKLDEFINWFAMIVLRSFILAMIGIIVVGFCYLWGK